MWQDLVDEELITPISDNEYVLKGSEISSKTDFSLGMLLLFMCYVNLFFSSVIGGKMFPE